MDIATIGGLVIGMGAVAVSFLIDGGQLGAIVRPMPMLLVIGGTIGASIITTSAKTLRSVPSMLRAAFSKEPEDPLVTIDKLVKMSEKARHDGILRLEDDLYGIKDPFFKKAVQLVVDGVEPDVLKTILETEIACIEDRHRKGIILLEKMGGFSPTLGIIGTVLGLIHTLTSASAEHMAEAIAGAFIATLWGVALANLCYLPLSDKLRLRHEEELATLDLIMEGIMSIRSGDNSLMVRSKLLSFVAPKLRGGMI
ncbi:MotA/TolQ/ExbB proton channel [uncultured Desulfobacterium sp.]|uniref:MotA/TolQ/ExbB proton channel n=1 Tax=uncultured Desulfobacterium sp. TaxID=201089 RepID=A0A445N0D6_9BACT|nr:MotA/TolQ/ExbB proton channel [uncultured Desulfobacterium sp.]